MSSSSSQVVSTAKKNSYHSLCQSKTVALEYDGGRDYLERQKNDFKGCQKGTLVCMLASKDKTGKARAS